MQRRQVHASADRPAQESPRATGHRQGPRRGRNTPPLKSCEWRHIQYAWILNYRCLLPRPLWAGLAPPACYSYVQAETQGLSRRFCIQLKAQTGNRMLLCFSFVPPHRDQATFWSSNAAARSQVINALLLPKERFEECVAQQRLGSRQECCWTLCRQECVAAAFRRPGRC